MAEIVSGVSGVGAPAPTCHCTTLEALKFDPLIVSVNPELPATALVLLSELMTGPGARTKLAAADVAKVGSTTRTDTVPDEVKRLVGIATVI